MNITPNLFKLMNYLIYFFNQYHFNYLYLYYKYIKTILNFFPLKLIDYLFMDLLKIH
jgi:hypothetical protein